MGRPDVLVNNAGVVRGTTLRKRLYADLQLSFDVNVGGTFLGMKAYLKASTWSSGAGRPGFNREHLLLSEGSSAGRDRSPTPPASSSVRGSTKAAAVELGPLGLRCQCGVPWTDRERHERFAIPQFRGRCDLCDASYVCTCCRFGHPPAGPIDVGEGRRLVHFGSDVSTQVKIVHITTGHSTQRAVVA